MSGVVCGGSVGRGRAVVRMGPAAAVRWVSLVLLSAPARGDVAAFRSWATSNGVSTAKVDLAPELGPGMRGMVAKSDITVGLSRPQSLELSLCAPLPRGTEVALRL